MGVPSNLVTAEEDLVYEEELLRNPYNLRLWLRYLDHKKSAPAAIRNLIHERAVKALPMSYKIWRQYLTERREQVKEVCFTDPSFETVNNCFERALVHLHKMPRIWEDYCLFLLEQHKVTDTRRALDRALRSLPVTQHDRIWKLYMRFVKLPWVPPETTVRVMRRFLKVEKDKIEEFVDYLVSVDRLDEAATQLADALNSDDFVPSTGKSHHQLWMELCDLIAKNPKKVRSLKVEPIVRQGLGKFSDEVGRLWCSLADFYIRSGQFERARDIYEEGVQGVKTVRDFSMVFDAYSQFEESLISARMEKGAGEGEEDGEDIETDLLLARLERLMDRRPELLSSVLLRQNPHNCHEWNKRAKLFADDPTWVIKTYTQAVKTIKPEAAVGKLHYVWVNFAKYYESHGDVDNARVIFEKAVQVNYTKVDDLATVWCEYAEMELRNKNYNEALRLMQRATKASKSSMRKEVEVMQGRKKELKDVYKEEAVHMTLYKSQKLWSFYVDLEESLGTVESTKACYERMLELRIATPQIVINYAHFLEEKNYFEDSFKVYEKGVGIFNFPYSTEIWSTYLKKFTERFGGTKLERSRDLFEQCLEKAPEDVCKPFYLLYARLEEEHGMARNAMTVYERAVNKVPEDSRLEVFKLYINRATAFFGVTKAREIYAHAIDVLPDKHVKEMCVDYAGVERKLGEIDRARALYIHGAQFADPKTSPAFWKTFHEFEVQHGNEDTFREMLRVKRGVQTQYSQVNFMSAEGATAGGKRKHDDIAALEAQALSAMNAFDNSNADDTVEMRPPKENAVPSYKEVVNPDAIDLDDDDDDDGGVEEKPSNSAAGDGAEMDLEKQAIPAAVFGDLAGTAKGMLDKDASELNKIMGAAERFKRAKKA